MDLLALRKLERGIKRNWLVAGKKERESDFGRRQVSGKKIEYKKTDEHKN